MTSVRLPAASLILLALLAGTAAADPGDEARKGQGRGDTKERDFRGHQSRPEHRSLAESVRRVERETGGQILSAERVPFDGRDMNRIKVLDSTGRVRVITEDPQRKGRRGDD
jgi:hypothetical protein